MSDLLDKEEIPSFEKMIMPVVMALRNLGGKANIEDIETHVVDIMHIPKDVTDILHKKDYKRTELSYRLAWARTYLKKYGIIENLSRGVWAFTDNFDGNIDNIDSDLIVRTVRQGNLDQLNNANISNFESHFAFEKFATAVLKDYLQSQNKSIIIPSYFKDVGYDLYLPDGIDNNDTATIVEIKFTRSNKSSYFRYVKDTCLRLLGEGHKQILFILGAVFTEKSKDSMQKMATGVAKANVIIWDYANLEEKMGQESKYMSFLVNPKKSIIEETIDLRIPLEQQENKKRNLIDGLKKSYLDENITLFLGARCFDGCGNSIMDRTHPETTYLYDK